MGNDRYTVIVVGAGLAGSTTAYLCASNNLSVLLLERGEYPGCKNLFGGVIYQEATSQIIPAFWEEAPLERPITQDILWFLDQNSAVQLGFTGLTFAKPPYNKFSAYRAKFDRWFAAKAVKAGANLLCSTLVEDLLFEKVGLTGRKACGVVLEDGSKIYADVVVIAEGGLPNLVLKAGLQKKVSSDSFSLYVKEILHLPPEVIEARFNLEKNEGANIGIIGLPSGAIGKAGLWTNKETVSLIVGGYLNQLINQSINPYQLLVTTKEHPLIRRLIQGAEVVEYLSRVIPKSGAKEMPSLYSDGVLVVGDALMNVGGQGTVLALLSGQAAAETVIQAAAKNQFDKETLATYEVKLNNTHVMKNNLLHQNTKEYYQNFPDSDLLINKVMNNIAYEFFTASLDTHAEKKKKIIEHLKTIQPLKKNLSDLYNGIQHWRVF